jgi:hypothetical protein
VILSCGGVTIDEVTYGSAFPLNEGKSLALRVDKDYMSNDEAASWCATSAAGYEYDGSSFGTPGADSVCE